MAPPHQSHPTADIAEKVLRRAEVAKVARNLTDCLALASFKAQNGWQDRTLRAIEPEVTEQLRRKRPHSSGDLLSDSSSNASDATPYASSPFTGPALSDDINFSGNSRRARFNDTRQYSYGASSRKRFRSQSAIQHHSDTSWKHNPRLAQSSPLFQQTPSFNQTHRSPLMPNSATLSDVNVNRSPMFEIPDASDIKEGSHSPVQSFHQDHSSGMISSSPPRTPSPDHRMRIGTSKQAGADLLLFLANSPSRSPAVHKPRESRDPPSTPPSRHTHIPLSGMNTPGANNALNGSFNTPGQAFNFADFVNITPSPAQIPWGGRTPGAARTPAIAKAARRSLNFETLMPPGGNSTALTRRTPASQGLALELGGELIPRA